MINNSIKVGDVIAGAWGATMVIPAFYEVVKVSPTGRLYVYELEKKMTSTDGFGQQGYEEPKEPHEPKFGELKCQWARPDKSYPGHYAIGSGYSKRYVSKWDGKRIFADYMD